MKQNSNERKKIIAQILEGEDETRSSLDDLIIDMDYAKKKTITFKHFESVIEKLARGVNYSELSSIANSYRRDGDSISYPQLLEDFSIIRRKKKDYQEILDNIYRKSLNTGINIMESFEDNDPKRSGYLDKYRFKDVIENIGIQQYMLDEESFFNFILTSPDGKIDYLAFYDDFCKYLKKIGKNPEDLRKDAYARDPKNYWARDIFEDAHKYFTKHNITLDEFFISHGMDSNNMTINPSNLMSSVEIFCPKIDKTRLYKLENELHDENKLISIAKFKKIYNVMIQGGGIENPEKVESTKFNQIVEQIIKKILNKSPSVDVYFAKFDYNKIAKVMDADKFNNILLNLDLDYTTEDKKLIKKKIGISDTKVDITVFLEFKLEEKGIESLERDQRIKFDKLCDEIRDVIKKERLNFYEEFRKQSPFTEDMMNYGDFKAVFELNRLNFRDDEVKLLSTPFLNPNKNNLINYKHFCDYLKMESVDLSKKTVLTTAGYVSQQLLEEKTREIYKEIRLRYGSIEDFFTKFDHNVGYMTSKDFSSAVSDLNIRLEYDQAEKLFEKFDRNNSGKVYLVGFTRAMEDLIESELRNMLDKICSSLNQASVSLDDILKRYVNRNTIRVLDLRSALGDKGINFKSHDIQFLLESIACKPDRESLLFVDDLKKQLQSSCERLNVANKNVLRSLFAASTQDSRYDDPRTSQDNRGGDNRSGYDNRYENRGDSRYGNDSRYGQDTRNDSYNKTQSYNDNFREFAWAREFFLDLHNSLKRRGNNFYDYFGSKKYEPYDLNRQLGNLGVNLTQKYSDLINDFKDRYSSYVDMNLFEKVYNNFKDEAEVSHVHSNRANDPFIELRERFRNKGKTFEQIFERGYSRTPGYMEVSEFKAILTQELNCYLSPQVLSDIIFELREKDMISLSKLRKQLAIGDEDALIDETIVLEKFKAAMKREGFDILSILNILRLNDLQYINFENFSRVIAKVLPDLRQQEIAKLYRFIDKNGDGKLSKNEFVKIMEDKNEKAEKILLNLKDLIRRSAKSPEQSFDKFDRDRRGYLNFDQFYDVIRHLDDNLTRADIEYLFRRFDEGSVDKVTRGNFVKILYDSDSFNAYDETRAKSLLNGLKQKVSKLDFVDIQKYLKHADPERNGTVTADNFQNFAINIDRDIGYQDARVIFRFLDVGGKGYINYDNFEREMIRGPSGEEAIVELNPEVLREAEWTREYFEEMAYILNVCTIDFESYFYSKDRYKEDFNRKFDYLDIVINPEYKEKFMEIFTDRSDRMRLDLKKMKDCYVYFSKNRKNLDDDFKGIHLNHIAKEISDALKVSGRSFDETFSSQDRMGKGYISAGVFENILKDLRIKNSVNRKILGPHVTVDGQVDINRLKKLVVVESGEYKDVTNILAQNVINEVRKIISSSGIEPEMVFDKFDKGKDGTINKEEFSHGLRMFNRDLRDDQIGAVFTLLDKEKKNLISKFRFLKAFGHIQPNNLPLFVLDSPARAFFQRVQDIKNQKKVDLYHFLKVSNGHFSRTNLDALSVLDLDPRRYAAEIDLVVEILADERDGLLSFELFMRCVDRAYEEIIHKFTQKELTDQEKSQVNKFFSDLKKIIETDTIPYEEIFHYKVGKEPEFISQEEYNEIIYRVNAERPTTISNLAGDSLKNAEGRVELAKLKELLGFKEEKASEVTEFIANLKKKFNNDTTEILKNLDKNSDRTISQREFRFACDRLFSMKNDESDVIFKILSKGEIEIKTIDLKNLLEDDVTSNKKLIRDLCSFILQNEYTLHRNFENFDAKRIGKLSLANMKMAFSAMQKFINESDLEMLLRSLKIASEYGGVYNYNVFLSAIREKDLNREDKEEFLKTLGRLKENILEKNIDIAQGLRILDADQSNRLVFFKIEDFLLKHHIIIRNDERESILRFLKAGTDEKVSISEFCDLIYHGVEDDSPKALLLQEAQYIKKLLTDIKESMKVQRSTSIYDFLGHTDTYIAPNKFEAKIQGIMNNAIVDDLVSMFSNNKEHAYLKDQSEMNILIGLCRDQSNGNVNLNMVDIILRENEQYRGKMSLVDAQFLDKTFNQLRGFIWEDKLSVEELISYCKPVKNAIRRAAFLDMLLKRIRVPMSEKVLKFVRMISDDRGFIECEEVKKNLAATMNSQPTQPSPRDEKVVSFGKQPSNLPPTQNLQPQNTQGQLQPQGANKGFENISMTESKLKSNSALRPTTTNVSAGNLDTKDPLKQSTAHIGAQSSSKFFSETQNKFNPSNQPGTLNNIDRNKPQPAYDYTKAFSGNLELDILDVFRARNLSNINRFLFFDDMATGEVKFEKFAQKVKLIVKNVTDDKIDLLFKAMDKNKTGVVSEPEFRIFMDDEGTVVTKSDVSLPKEIKDEILKLFRSIDSDNSGTLDIQEMIRSFSQLASPPTNDEIKVIFAEYDKNGDGKISQDEFFQAMENKIKKDIIQIEDILARLREEFKKVDVNKNRELTYDQTLQAISNLGIALNSQEGSALMAAIDKDKSGKIDIDEFIGFIISPPDANSLPREADAAIMNIRFSKKISIMDMFECFKDMPYNFISSFSRELMKKQELTPSSAFRPKLNSSGVVYVDLKPIFDKVVSNDPKKKKNAPVENTILPIASSLAANIKLTLATGVPIPADGGNKRDSIIGREVRVLMYNNSSQKFLGNIVRIGVDWKIEYEDRWYFLPNKVANENCVSIRLANFNDKTDANLDLVFEFIVYFKKDSQIVEMSNGWASISLANLMQTKTHEIALNGGTPYKPIQINQDDIRTNRTGWRSVVKKLSKSIASKLTIEVDSQDRMKKEELAELEYLPASCIINKNSIQLIRVYRNYMGKILLDQAERGITPNLMDDMKTRVFLKCVDCPDVYPSLVRFWNSFVVNAKTKNTDPTFEVNLLKKVLNNMYLLFNCSDFAFNHLDPSGTVDPNLQNIRKNIVDFYLYQGVDELSIPITKKPFTTYGSQSQKINYKPFSIDELLEDENDKSQYDAILNMKMNLKN